MNKFLLVVLVVCVAGWYSKHQERSKIVAQAGGDLVMYTTTDCPYCAEARAWLKKNNIAYRECDTEKSRACDAELTRLGGDGVPTFLYKGEVHNGLNLQWMQSTLLNPT